MVWMGLCVFTAVFCAVIGCQQLLEYRRARRALKDHLRQLSTAAVKPSRFLLAWADKFDQGPKAKMIALDLARADLQFKPSEFVALQCLVGLVLYFVASSFMGLVFPLPIVMAIFGVRIGKRLWLGSRRNRYVSRFNHQLPELSRFLSSALKAGLSIQQAIELAGRDLAAPAGPEMRRTAQELKLSVPLDRALDGLMNRVHSQDLTLLSTTIIVQWQVGGDLAGALESLSRTLSEREQLMGELRGLTAEQRFVSIMLPFMPLIAAMLMNMAIPGFLNPIFTLPGLILVTVFAVIQTVAFLLVRNISNIQV